MTKIIFTKFRQQYDLNVLAVYLKGKQAKQDITGIRLLIEHPHYAYMMGKGVQLYIPTYERPKFIFNRDMLNGTCGVTGLPMRERPEFIGDLDNIIKVDITNGMPEHIKHRCYNYYLVTKPAITNKLLNIVVDKIPALSFTGKRA